MQRPVILFVPIALFIGLIALLPLQSGQTKFFHTPEELAIFNNLLPVDTNLIFPPASSCSGCHGFDPNGYAMVDAQGNDVNIFDDWKTTLMANSTRDPFWRAKVSHEVLLLPAHQAEIESKCTTCHAPMGNYTSRYQGDPHYTIATMLGDTIGMEGVSCGACHMISEENLGFTFSGEMHFDTNRVLFGPFDFPFAAPMIQYVGYEPIFSPHISDAGICASCHTLITEPFDYEGNLIGTTFVEQATYHEWLNSQYDADDVSCQFCHMPKLDEPVVISANYLFLEGREPYSQHELVGANSFMLEILRDYKGQLGIQAEDEHFNETIARTLSMLQEKTLDLEVTTLDVLNDTAYFAVDLYNKAGHKFPSGYPSRRAWVEFLVVTEAGDTLFHSGRLRADYEVQGQEDLVEPHYSFISDPENQVQIYEFVAGDLNGEFTTVLEYGYAPLKDNRLPPIGFTSTHPAYDTTAIVGEALFDPDFNKAEGPEGSGSDRIRYHVALNDYVGNVNVLARVHYQSLPPRWLNPMLEFSTPEIDSFRPMYQNKDNTPVLVKEASLANVFVEGGVSSVREFADPSQVRLYPVPSSSGRVELDIRGGKRIRSIRVWAVSGQLVAELKGQRDFLILPAAGTYWLEIALEGEDSPIWKKAVRIP